MERLEVIKTSELVAEVCAAAGSLKGYTFSSAADVPSSSNVPGSSGDSSRRPEQPQGTSLKNRVVNRSQGHLSACVLNLGNWERSRKRSTPQCLHHLIDWNGTLEEQKRDPTCGNLLIHFPSNSSAHVLIVQEASTIRHQQSTVVEEHGWLTATSPDKTLLRGIRANPWPGAYVRYIAGARTVRRHKETPLAYAIFEACFRDEPRREDWERAGLSHDKEAQRELLREDNPAKDKIIRSGMHVIRVCSFHLNNQAATDSPALCGELLSSMVADCFHYQVDMAMPQLIRLEEATRSHLLMSNPYSRRSSNPSEMPLCHVKEATLQ